ncbi:hypothetical protein F2Q69_00049849 [Brassica cretica]|uniref:Uncharacterized protein n=1 Tax=Brassica cretica TaxID=69181 RepID=A0A8S9PJB3_BRACR|nr:hypothetical protein F2Q69_00049849 [Brassica cretica]
MGATPSSCLHDLVPFAGPSHVLKLAWTRLEFHLNKAEWTWEWTRFWIGYFKIYSTSDLKQSGMITKSVRYRRGTKMELTQNLNRWMSADGYPLQGRLVAGVLKDKDQDSAETALWSSRFHRLDLMQCICTLVPTAPSRLKMLVVQLLVYSVWRQRNMLHSQSITLPLVVFKDINRQVIKTIYILRNMMKFRNF